jgi:hypothetical protein
MSRLANLIKEINTQISTVSESFVYYNKETSKIQKISNKKINSELEVFKIETSLVHDIIVGKKKSDDFIVTYDLSEKRLTVKEITYESELSSVKYKLYDITQSTDTVYDVKIGQDLLKKCWKINLSNNSKKELLGSKYHSNDKIYFSITQKHNPNILYRSLEASLQDLLNSEIEYPFEYNWEIQNKEVSIYTPKLFDSYIYEVIK